MNKKLLKILVPACMILVVFGLWYMEQKDKPAKVELANAHATPFSLVASSIDLAALKNLNVPIIIDFGADSCIPCKEMAPVLVKINAEMQDKAIIKFVDVWKNPKGSEGFPVQVIPTQIIFNADGTPYVPKQVADIEFVKYSMNETNEHAFTAHQGGLTEAQMRNILKDLGVE